MGKGTIFVFVYSLILLILFSTFSFLMTTVNPPRLKPKSVRLKKFEAINDELLYPNEILQPNDNVAYGLEKVDYDAIEVYNRMSNWSEYRRSEAPKSINEEKTNTSKGSKKHKTASDISGTENGKYKTDKRKLAKGFRRSIREKPNVLNSKLLSLLLNIKLFNGQPRIEIKVLNPKNEEKAKENDNFIDKRKKLNISDIGYIDNDVVRELQENDTLLVQVVNNMKKTCGLNVSKSNVCKEKRESIKELIVEIVNSSETSDTHLLDLRNSKADENITTKSDQLLEITKEKYEINVTSPMPSNFDTFNASK